MAFSCTRPKTKDDLHRNIELEKQIDKLSSENIELTNMNLTDEDIPIIIKKVLKKKKITSLSLANNKITSDGIKMIVNTIKSNKKLTHLILSTNPIGDQGIHFIIDLIRNNRTIYHLSLVDTQITDNGMKMISDTLRTNSTSLRTIDLRSNILITDSSIDSILQMIEQNQTLSTCRLDNCGFTQQGKDTLREAKSITCLSN